jgi:GTP-binding protein EngB required for normal cell division
MNTATYTEQPGQLSSRVLNIASEVAERYQIASIRPLLESAAKLSDRDELSVAVVGRFKAGKSSFLNHFLQRNLLPVGVVPVTTVVTEIAFGPTEKARVHFLNGEVEPVALDEIRSFVAERENPGNLKGVSTVVIELPSLAKFRKLRFIDMPGLESALTHNNEAALNWLPNVGVALVAVSVDPPLGQQDIALLKSLYQHTPKVSLLLTKIDLVSEPELDEVITFVRDQLERNFGLVPPIFPYSVRNGYEEFQVQVEEVLVHDALVEFHNHYEAILQRKLATLLRECSEYLRLALKSAETIESEREALKGQVLGAKESLDEEKSELCLVVQHAVAGTRTQVAKRLKGRQAELEERLLAELKEEFPRWTRSLNQALQSFEKWLRRTLTHELSCVSVAHRADFIAPLEKLKRQVFRSLQHFRLRLSDRTERAFGVQLRTTEAEIEILEPYAPDIRIGHVFDHNWELLSPIVPMRLVGPLVRRHFTAKVPDLIERNLSRLASQWDECLRPAMTEILHQAQRRLDDLVATVERLVSTSANDMPRVRADLERIGLLVEEIKNADSEGWISKPASF